jgi:Holliday junction resolvase RusA-like endonuclease
VNAADNRFYREAEPSPDLALVVWGKPGTAGSKKPFAVYRKGADGQREFTGRINMTDDAARRKDSPGATWRQAVVDAAREQVGCQCPEPGCTAMREGYPLTGPLEMTVVFTWPRPGSLKREAGGRMITTPDVLKLLRGTEDALKDAGVMNDDAQFWQYRRLAKVYPDTDPMALPTPGAVIYIWRTTVPVEPVSSRVARGDALW